MVFALDRNCIKSGRLWALGHTCPTFKEDQKKKKPNMEDREDLDLVSLTFYLVVLAEEFCRKLRTASSASIRSNLQEIVELGL